MSNVTECYKALEGAVPVVQASPFFQLLKVIELQAAYEMGFEDGELRVLAGQSDED
jgi:hypothetical protein